MDKKVLMVLDSVTLGGVETHVVTLSKMLKEKGCSVTVVAKAGPLSAELESNGVKFLELKDNFSLKSLFEIRKYILFEGIEIIHNHHLRTLPFALLLAFLTGSKYIATVHGIWKYGYIPINKMIAISNEVKEYLINDEKVKPENITVIPNGIDLDKFKFSIKPFSAKGDLVVSFISRFHRDKSGSLDHVLKIVPELYSRFSNLKVNVVGSGNDFESVTEKVKRLNASVGKDIVNALGEIDDIPGVLRDSHVVLGEARIVMEALACGKPTFIVCPKGFAGLVNSANFHRLLLHNFSARMPENEYDQDSVAQHITEIFKSEKLYQKVCQESRELAEKFLNISAQYILFVKSYSSAKRLQLMDIIKTLDDGFQIFRKAYFKNNKNCKKRG